MKRSEMVDIIYRGMSINNLAAGDVSYILDIVEKAGMLPPIESGMSQYRWLRSFPEAFEPFKWEDESPTRSEAT